jgi:nickel-dependent lactate racemase
MRDNAEKVARVVGLDIVFNTVLNSRREVSGLFVGDLVQAQRAGCRFAKTVYGTPISADALKNTDVVLINTYPLDYDPVQVGKSTWPVDLFENAYKVIIDAASDGIMYHGLAHKMDYARHLRTKKEKKANIRGHNGIGSKDQIIMLSTGFAPDDFYKYNENGLLFDSAEALMAELKRVKPRAKVAVLPCSSIQLPEIE